MATLTVGFLPMRCYSVITPDGRKPSKEVRSGRCYEFVVQPELCGVVFNSVLSGSIGDAYPCKLEMNMASFSFSGEIKKTTLLPEGLKITIQALSETEWTAL